MAGCPSSLENSETGESPNPAADLTFEHAVLQELADASLPVDPLGPSIASFHGPMQLSPGQPFTLRVSSQERPASDRSNLVVHIDGTQHALHVNATPTPSAAGVVGAWSMHVHGRLNSTTSLAGEDTTISIARIGPGGVIGPAITWFVEIAEAPLTIDCTTAPSCSDRGCGRDPICASECGVCDPGLVCADAGQCLPVGPACPAAAECEQRACGRDPVCGIECGVCPNGQSCSSLGQCEALDGRRELHDPG